MTDQNFVYECSRGNAAHTISNSEWVNEWNEGIKLKQGDSVRLLGSFISEAGDGNDIAIDTDTSFTIDFYPYMNAETVQFGGAVDNHFPGKFQMKLGDIAQPAYATDNFGIEPPYTSFLLNTHAAGDNVPSLNDKKRLQADRFYFNLIDTDQTCYRPDQNSSAVKIGAHLDTSTNANLITTTQRDDEKLLKGTLSDFNQKNVTEEYYIAHMCKLANFPLFKGTYHLSTGDEATGTHVTQTYYEDDILNPGDNISTYNIANYPKLATLNADRCIHTTGEQFGEVRWEAGPISLVGSVVATKIVYQDVYDPIDNITRAMKFQKAYIQDFSNPGQYKHFNDMDGPTRAPRHGSAELRNGYNNLRNNNRTNGFTQASPVYSGLPANTNNILDYYKNEVNDYEKSNNPAFAANTDQQQTMLGETTTTGLSFPWAGSGNTMKWNYREDSTTSRWTSWIKYITDLGIQQGTTIPYPRVDIGATVMTIQTNNNLVEQWPPNTIISNNTWSGVWTNRVVSIVQIETNKYTVTLGEPMTVALTPVGGFFGIQLDNGGWYWRPLMITETNNGMVVGIEATRTLSNLNSDSWNDVGAIVRMNPNDDNNAAYTPIGTNLHRLYIPFAEQSVNSPYNARHWQAPGTVDTGYEEYVWPTNPAVFKTNYQNPTTGAYSASISYRKRYNFGQSAAYGGAGDTRDPANRTLPAPYFYTLPATVNQVQTYEPTVYNDSVLSIHFQNSIGDCKFARPATNQDKENKIWNEDLVYIKKYKAEFTIPKGFYETNRLAEIIDDQLHMNFEEYSEKVGKNTSVGPNERQLTTGANTIQGNFIHTYLPDITYGFFPVQENDTNIDYPTSRTACVNGLFKDYTTDAFNGTVIANGYEYYFAPYTHDNDRVTPLAEDGTITMFRLIGARLSQTTPAPSNEMTDINPSNVYNARTADVVAKCWTTIGTDQGSPLTQFGDDFSIIYQSRSYMNRMTYGGAAKCWIGAVNPTFEYDPDTRLFNFNFLYTPYRPAAAEDGSPLDLVSGLGVPSAIINTIGSGGITASLSGEYFHSLIGEQIDATNTRGLFNLFNYGNDFPTTNFEYVGTARKLWNTLGFSDTLLATFSASTPFDRYLFFARDEIKQTILRNTAMVDISANGANPGKSYCSLWCPPVQYTVIVESDRIFADRRPKFASSPFYLIGSSFPTKEYYGGKGTKLPVIGVCSRQFSSFGFSFDLSESAITYTIDQDCTITSITTKIYNNDFTSPQNLDENSAVIYVISRPNYYQAPNQKELELGAKEILEQNPFPQYTVEEFEYTNPTYYQAPLFYGDDEDSDFDDV